LSNYTFDWLLGKAALPGFLQPGMRRNIIETNLG